MVLNTAEESSSASIVSVARVASVAVSQEVIDFKKQNEISYPDSEISVSEPDDKSINSIKNQSLEAKSEH